MSALYLNDIDPQFIKSIGFMYSNDNLPKGDTVPLQFFLEEAIKAKSGVTKDLTALVSAAFKQRRLGEYKPFISTIEESKGSNSDNELELDLFKEDLMCIICNGMDVGARNRLLECSDCHMLYHQECHKPIVTLEDSFDTWVCQNCKDKNAKLNDAPEPLPVEIPIITPITTVEPITTATTSVLTTAPIVVPVLSTTPPVTPPITPPTKTSSTSTKSTSSSNRHNSSHKSSKSDKYSKSNNSSKSVNSQKTPSSSSNSRSNVTPNINIISADKRIQIMKKKAAKLQEKRKHLVR